MGAGAHLETVIVDGSREPWTCLVRYDMEGAALSNCAVFFERDLL